MANSYTALSSELTTLMTLINARVQTVVASESPTPAFPLGAVNTDNYTKALVDALLVYLFYSYQVEPSLAAPASTSSITFVQNTAIGSNTVNVPIAGDYLISIDLSHAMSVLSGALRDTFWQLKVNGVLVGPVVAVDFTTANFIQGVSWQVKTALVAGNNTIELFWRVFDVGSTALINSACRCSITVQR